MQIRYTREIKRMQMEKLKAAITPTGRKNFHTFKHFKQVTTQSTPCNKTKHFIPGQSTLQKVQITDEPRSNVTNRLL